MYVFVIIKHFTHQFIGRCLFRADIFRRRDNQLHLQTFARSSNNVAMERASRPRRFIEEQQTAKARYPCRAGDETHLPSSAPRITRIDIPVPISFPGRQRAGLRARSQPSEPRLLPLPSPDSCGSRVALRRWFAACAAPCRSAG